MRERREDAASLIQLLRNWGKEEGDGKMVVMCRGMRLVSREAVLMPDGTSTNLVPVNHPFSPSPFRVK